MKSLFKIIIISLLFLISYSRVIAQVGSLEATLSLKNVSGIVIPYQNGIPLPTFEKQKSRTIIDLSGEWKKQRFSANDNFSLLKRNNDGISIVENEAAGRHLSNYDDSSWEKKNLPAVENALTVSDAPNGLFPESYSDGIWYRRSFNVDASNSGKFVKLIFYAVNYVCDVWINNHYVGYHEGGYSSFAFDVSQYLNYGTPNSISIRIDNIAWSTRRDIIPFNQVDWFNYAGLIHDVYLEISNPISVIRANIIPKDIQGNLETTVVLNNNYSVSSNVKININVFEADVNQNNIESEFANDLSGSEVQIAGESESVVSINPNDAAVWKTNIQIQNPNLWSMKSPNLYILKVTLTSGSNKIDEYSTQFGIRTVEARNGKFLLNNRIMFLPGVARHEDHPDFGRSLPKRIIYSDLVTVKSVNATYLRTAHYPNHPYTYLIADRLGLAIMEEIPLWQWDTQDVWDIQNNTRKIHQQMFREMVFRDFNRPSIIMWSTSNECHLDGGGRLVYHNTIKNDYRSNYNDGRLLTQSAAADKPGATDITQEPLDVAGWTIYFGIFYGTSKNYLGPTFSFLNAARTAFPTKPIIDTEFGYWSSENGSTEAEQLIVFNQTFSAFKYHTPYDVAGIENQSGNLIGTTWWCIFDWYQNKPKKSGWQTMGLITMDRKTEKQVALALKNGYLPFASKDGIVVSVEENNVIPGEIQLDQNYPNPFNPSTTIQFSISHGGSYTLKIYDILGREITTLFNGELMPGEHKLNFAGDNYCSGIYYYRLTGGNSSTVKKMLLLK
ncbi:MAG: glycoside hydrolase family 2 TIM barrel-domain containing protein [Melioribacteraceae bacterium]|nr:glycoside hydrolase family 2 TIM barrel-domain containing protein [Melioribacteraceae bacterium]